jgi:hypothetical protein
LKADNEYLIARAYQCMGDFEAAAQHFEVLSSFCFHHAIIGFLR